jgi:hypothetical protein
MGISHGDILRPIRNIYLTLHLHTDSAPTAFDAYTDDEDYYILSDTSSYPLCNIPDHRPDSTTHIHDVSISTTIRCAVLHDNDAPVPPSLADVPSPSVLTPPFTLTKPPWMRQFSVLRLLQRHFTPLIKRPRKVSTILPLHRIQLLLLLQETAHLPEQCSLPSAKLLCLPLLLPHPLQFPSRTTRTS